MIYFIQSGENGPIKIGYTQNLERRFRHLQCASPYRLTVLGTTPGTTYVERYYHSYYADERLEGEWFKPSERLLEQIRLVTTDELAASVYPGDPIPQPEPPKRRRGPRKSGFSCPSRLKRFMAPYEDAPESPS